MHQIQVYIMESVPTICLYNIKLWTKGSRSPTGSRISISSSSECAPSQQVTGLPLRGVVF